jgi:aminoglycoside 3-N-acetyltransferase
MLSALRAVGLQAGDCIFVHMALKKLGTFDAGGAETFDALFATFMKAIGPNGTLIVPTFNFGFCKGQDYDPRLTKSEGMGQFAEYVRLRGDALRSKHPFQSVAVVGAQTERIANRESKSAFSENSSFDEMLRCDCKIVFFGVPFVETFVHIAEERARVDYRFWKTFKANVIENGVPHAKEVAFFARDLDIRPEPHIDNDKLYHHLSELGLLTKAPLGSGLISVARAKDLVAHLTEKLQADNRFALET